MTAVTNPFPRGDSAPCQQPGGGQERRRELSAALVLLGAAPASPRARSDQNSPGTAFKLLHRHFCISFMAPGPAEAAGRSTGHAVIGLEFLLPVLEGSLSLSNDPEFDHMAFIRL